MAARKKKPVSKVQKVLQLRIELADVTPKVWRVVTVPAAMGLDQLHLTLNEAMGWNNSHLHEFVIGGRKYSDVRTADGAITFQDESMFRLDEVVKVGDRFEYAYDFGDGWEHVVKVEKELPFDDRVAYPVCLAGKRACPPEDCGGPDGYAHLLAVLDDPDDGEHDELVQWIGGAFDAEGFDPNRTTHGMRAVLQEDYALLTEND